MYPKFLFLVSSGVLEQAEQLGSRQLLSPLLCLCSLLRYLLDAAQNAGATFSRSCVESYQIDTAPEALKFAAGEARM